jgi:uroporphyrinogen decarboxylase
LFCCHTCGACATFIPELIDNGIDILNPVQISADHMAPAALKQQFGSKLAFWGGAIDAQHVLPNGTPDQIRNDVRNHLDAFKPGGGYVFNNVHNIQAGVPPENVLALYDAAYEFGRYS